MSLVRTAASSLILCCVCMAPALADHVTVNPSDQRSEAYRDGQRALESEDWEEASRIFGKVAAGSSAEADAALYWKAYADWKQNRKPESLEGVRKLLTAYPKSPWVDDAKALEQEIRSGKKTATARAGEDNNEELKLYALDGLMQRDAEQALPALEKLLAGNSSERVKQRALFVLSQSDSPRARAVLTRIARTGQPMSLRREAVRTLGMAGEPEDIAALNAIARDKETPVEIREAAIDGFMIAGRSEELLGIAKSDPDPHIRSKAIDALGASDALPALRQLWSTERDPQIRAKLLQAFGIAGDVETLSKAARDADPQIRRKAIEGLGISGTPEAAKLLQKLYGELADPDDKRKVLEAIMIQDDAKTLLAMFRAERDPRMKRLILQQLSMMDDPEATKLILEVLEEEK